MKNEISICGKPRKEERANLSATLNVESSIKENACMGEVDMTEMEDDNKLQVTRVDLLQHLFTWIYETEKFEFVYLPKAKGDEVDNILATFRDLYEDPEAVHTLECKKTYLKIAYWEICSSEDISFRELEHILMMRALELMQSARFKKMMKAVGEDIDEDELAWSYGWMFATHFVLKGSETVSKFVRNCKDTPFEIDENCDEPFFEIKRLYEVIDTHNPYHMWDLLSIPSIEKEYNKEVEKEEELDRQWLASRLI